jgi:hypothetical protein
MSAIPHETRSAGRKPVGSSLTAALLRKTAAKVAHLWMQAAMARAEARMHQARIEAELYRNQYTHTSKNDDELPVDMRAEPDPAEKTWRRFADAIVAMARRAYPAILVLSLLSTALAATIAIRLAIWLPAHLYLSPGVTLQ